MSSNMTQIKFTIETDIVSAFRSKCKSEGVSMTSVIRQSMKSCQYVAKNKTPHTRPMRRKAVQKATELLVYVLEFEEQYRDSIPEQFSQRFETANHACEQLSEAIACLEDAYY